MIFIGLAWWDSTRMVSRFFHGHCQAWHMEGYAALQYNPLDRYPDSQAARTSPRDDSPRPRAPIIASAAFRRGEALPPYTPAEADALVLDTNRDWMLAALRYMPRETWIILIPHWLILLAFALPWTGLLVWRTKRIKQPQCPG